MSQAFRNAAVERLMAGRRAGALSVRDLGTGSDAAPAASFDTKAFGSGRTWLAAAIANIAIVFGVAFCVVLGPPVLECRRQAVTGFSAGGDVQGCIRKATAERLHRLDSQLTMMVRGSGR